MTSQPSPTRTRRAILTAALGAGAATVVAAVARPLPVDALDGDTVHVGNAYDATTVTSFDTGTSGENALMGVTTIGVGVIGSASGEGTGVLGGSDSGAGVAGTSVSSDGVVGESSTGNGLRGLNGQGADLPVTAAVFGISGGSTGVQGFSGQGVPNSAPLPPAAPALTGVFGYADTDATARGVIGKTTVGHGVDGIATTGTGAMGSATTGIGTRGYAATGTAGYFSTSNPMAGIALHARGWVAFDKSVGVATLATATSSITVVPGIDLTPASAVVATLQGNPSGTAVVRSVAINTTTNKFTIHFSGTLPAGTKVAWHVFG